MRGRKPKEESRAAEFREQLIAWKQTPAASRLSLRALARELGTSHQLLSHYLLALEESHRQEALEGFRAKVKARNLTLTPRDERSYLAWLRRVEERRARNAARAAKWATKHAALLESIKHLRADSWSAFRTVKPETK